MSMVFFGVFVILPLLSFLLLAFFQVNNLEKYPIHCSVDVCSFSSRYSGSVRRISVIRFNGIDGSLYYNGLSYKKYGDFKLLSENQIEKLIDIAKQEAEIGIQIEKAKREKKTADEYAEHTKLIDRINHIINRMDKKKIK